MPSYNPKVIEPRWQKYWLEHKTFRTPDLSDKPKYYILDMFPYPSGAGLHVGHPEGYTATDILARYKRMRGFNVLHPMGWDAFGLPAEQHAIKTGEHPSVNTQNNIANFRRQIQMLGFSYDWDREVDTTDPNYFRWTQWIFLQLYDTWYDPEQKKGRPIAELPIPDRWAKKGEEFVRIYRDKTRLAYQIEAPVNWCPALGTVLANEEVQDGKSEVGGHPVLRMPLRQWMLRITAYAERLLEDLEQVDWSEAIKGMQRNWIGKSEGAEVDFLIRDPKSRPDDLLEDVTEWHTVAAGEGFTEKPGPNVIRVFTTRPDTLFGATYMVLAPEHPLVTKITTPEQRAAVVEYQEAASRKSDLERTELAKQKTGEFTGTYAINPVNGRPIEIWVADYVLATYGTGAIMAVPAHDERDFEFACQFNLPIRAVVRPTEEWLRKTGSTLNQLAEPYTEEGVAIHSGQFDGLPTAEFKKKITAWLTESGLGAGKVNYKLRDWLFSRQRYWGEPFPLLHEIDADGKPTGVVEPLTPEELPLRLPDLEDYKPSGRPEPPLGKAPADWLYVTRNGKRYRRETNTMPQWAGSCWYYLRYLDPHNDKSFCDPQKEKYGMPVDLYVGGAEHAVLHLLYSRFWHKVLYDRGHVHNPEPFQKLVNQGMILGITYFLKPEDYATHAPTLARIGVLAKYSKTEEEEIYILGNPGKEKDQLAPLDERQIEERKNAAYLAETDIRVNARAEKMSKSRGNVINPDEVVNQYGADSLRLYEMFMGPLEATKPWSMRGVEGVYRFLGRVWRLFIDERSEEEPRLAESVQDVPPERETLRKLHQTIQKVTGDLDGMRFNTAISAMMEFTNHLTPLTVRPRSALEPFVLLLSPFAPHLAEELWRLLGHTETLAYEPWPTFDPALAKEDSIEVPVQINGKVRLRLTVPADVDETTLKALALADPKVRELLGGKEPRKVIVVPKKLVNIVV